MNSVANASVGVIEKFKGENSDLDYCLNTLRNNAWSAITQLKSACENKLKTYSAMLEETDGLVAKAAGKRSASQYRSSARAGNALAQAENLRDYLRSLCERIKEMIKTLDNYDSTVYPMIDKTLVTVTNADGALKAAISAINEYKTYTLR